MLGVTMFKPGLFTGQGKGILKRLKKGVLQKFNFGGVNVLQKDVSVSEDAGRKIRFYSCLALGMGVLLIGSVVMAWKLPNDNSFAYETYKVFVNEILQGAPGAVAAVALMAGGIISAVRSNFLGAGICSVGSILLYDAPKLIQTLGFNI